MTQEVKPTGFTFEIDDGVVNFGDDVTISNSGSDYYISADDEDSSIKYSVTTEDKTSATTAIVITLLVTLTMILQLEFQALILV